MKSISIKCVDGSRYEYLREDDAPMFDAVDHQWVEMENAGVIRRFYIQNIVTVTIRPEEES